MDNEITAMAGVDNQPEIENSEISSTTSTSVAGDDILSDSSVGTANTNGKTDGTVQPSKNKACRDNAILESKLKAANANCAHTRKSFADYRKESSERYAALEKSYNEAAGYRDKWNKFKDLQDRYNNGVGDFSEYDRFQYYSMLSQNPEEWSTEKFNEQVLGSRDKYFADTISSICDGNESNNAQFQQFYTDSIKPRYGELMGLINNSVLGAAVNFKHGERKELLVPLLTILASAQDPKAYYERLNSKPYAERIAELEKVADLMGGVNETAQTEPQPEDKPDQFGCKVSTGSINNPTMPVKAKKTRADYYKMAMSLK